MIKSVSNIIGCMAACLAAGSLVFFAGGCGKDDSSAAAETETPAVPVNVKPCRMMVFEHSVEVSASVQAKDEVLVSPRIKGVLDAIYVDEGDRVAYDATELFQIDKVTLSNAVDSAAQQVSVARAAEAAAEATLVRMQADRDQAQLDADRYRRLYENDKAVTSVALEKQQTRLAQLNAAVSEAAAAVKLAAAQVGQAESNLAIARKNLSDSLIVAPVSGTVSVRMAEPGEMVEPARPVLKIVDLSRLEVSAVLPERYYDEVHPGRTRGRLVADGRDLGELAVSFRSPVVDPRLRTFEIRVDLTDPPADIVPGRLVKLSVIIASESGLGAPQDAVVTRGGRQVVFVARSGKAVEVPVETGMLTDGMIELVSEQLAEGDLIVANGQRFCSDGSPLKILEGGR